MQIDQFAKNYFPTDNTALAFALRNAGVKWKDPTQPCWNVYTHEMLKRYGVSTIQEAVQKGRPGKVTYFLDRPSNLEFLLKAWDSQNTETEKIEEGIPSERILDIDAEDLMCVAAHLLKSYGKFKTIWREVEPKLYVKNAGGVRKSKRSDGSTIYKHPGARLASANAKPETLRRLRLK